MSGPTVLHEDEDSSRLISRRGWPRLPAAGSMTDASLHAWVTRHIGARTYIVHRLDRGTSGVIVFAKTSEAHRRLSQAFEAARSESATWRRWTATCGA